MASDPIRGQEPIKFGEDFELDVSGRRLRRRGHALKLERIPLEILILLIKHWGEIVTRDEIVEEVWGKGVFLDTDNSIRGAIRKIRHALKDNPEHPQFVQTVTGRGYRFIAPTSQVEDPSTTNARQQLARDALPRQPSVEPPHSSQSFWIRVRPVLFSPVATHRAPPVHRWALLGLLVLLVFLAILGFNVESIRDRLPGRSAPTIKSIAVLPLDDLSSDPNQEYLADGVTEALITELGKISSLRVISRTSVMQYKRTKKPLKEIARELNVDALVEGSVARAGDHVRITANLLQASPEKHLWAETYDREMRDVLALQGQLASTIVREVQLKLKPEEKVRLSHAQSVSPEVYELYLKGRYFWNKRDPVSIKKAIKYFRQTIDHAPNYAPGYAGLADAYQFQPDTAAQEILASSKAAYAKALELDDTLAEAHAGLGLLLMSLTYDWANSERELKRAIELNTNYATAHQWYSTLLAGQGRREEAKAEIRKALQLDPLSPIINCHFAARLNEEGRFDEAISYLQRVQEMDPNFWTAHYFLAEAFLKKGMFKEAITEQQQMKLLLGQRAEKVDRETEQLRRAYATTGPRGYWQKRLELAVAQFTSTSNRTFSASEVTRFEIATYYARLGDREGALKSLAQSYADREPELRYIKVLLDFDFRGFDSDPRFQELVRHVGLLP
jgi:TolB-like protein/DNA-binding winged helix-turn-helix (wHTH) protein